MNKYQPIACALYDYLELLIVKKQEVILTFQEEKIKTKIIDLFTKKGEEYAILEMGQTIRLDAIIKIDNTSTGEFIHCKI